MQSNSKTKMKVVVAGGGTSGWLAAAALKQQLGGSIELTLVESSDIGTIGVGEATIPPMKTFHRLLRIDEREFMRATNATFKLGIQFEDWKELGDKYFHSFGTTGKDTLITEFVHFWLRGRELGIAKDFGDYCVEYKAALEGRCSAKKGVPLNYAFHLDAGLYARFLQNRAEAAGAKRVEGKIVDVIQDVNTGYINRLTLDSGEVVDGDLFIDCTGFRGLLIEQTLHSGFEDWSHWLPCNRAVAVQTEAVSPPPPYTRSMAHNAGWCWRIPLQNRVGNGSVYCSQYMSDDEAAKHLLEKVEGKPITEPKFLQFKTGRRRQCWNKNCVAIGLSSGFVEPLESTSIHLVMTAITRLLQLFPRGGVRQSVIDEYNRQANTEIERIRDFIILHYKATERSDSRFWRYCKQMKVPAELSHRINLFRESGKSYQVESELFRLDSWVQVMLGQGIIPESYHPIVSTMEAEELKAILDNIEAHVDQSVNVLSRHEEFLKLYCSSL